MTDLEVSEDYRLSAGHVMVLAVLLAVPVLKLTWTLGGGEAARDALIAMGPTNWLDIVIGMFLAEPLPAAVLAVVVGRATYAYLAAKGGARGQLALPMTAVAASAAIVPVALGIVVGAFNGLAWGLGTAIAAYVLRIGVVVEYATGLRTPETGKRSGRPAATLLQRAADVTWITGLALGGLVLPLLAVADALDGRSWTSVLNCDVDTGTGGHRSRVIEIDRDGTGVVAWDLSAGEIVNGTGCATDTDEVIRPPWWRSR